MNSAIREYFVRQEHLFENRDQQTKTGWSRKNFRTWNRSGLGARKIFTKILKISDRFDDLRIPVWESKIQTWQCKSVVHNNSTVGHRRSKRI